jgi:hypothetical protein
LQFLEAVFFTFSGVGFLLDLANPTPGRTAHILFLVFTGGAIGIAYGICFMLAPRLMPVLVALHVVLAIVVPPHLGSLAVDWAQVASTAAGVDLIGCLLNIVLGYVFFVRFIRSEGQRYVRVQTEMELAHDIHRRLVPPIAVSTQHHEFYGLSVPSGEMGGDLVDLVQDGNKWVGYLADVSGHGVPSGIMMAMVKSAARMRLISSAPPYVVLEDLNRVISELKAGDNTFVTLAFLTSGTADDFHFATAGHPPILHFRSATLALLPFLHAVATLIADGEFVSPHIYWRSSPRGVDALAYFMPNPNHRLFGGPGHDWLQRERLDGFAENAAALTLAAPAVILLGFWHRRRALPARWAFFAIFFALLALGPFVWVGGVNTWIPTPWAVLRFVPGIGLVHSPGRFAVVVMMALCVLFALAVTELLRRHPRHRWLVTAAIGAALLFELAPLPRPLYSAEIPGVFKTIADDPRDVRVLELPTGIRDGTSSTGQYSAAAQFHQTLHGKPLVGGYLSRVSANRVRASRRFPVLDALFTLSAGDSLTPEQRQRAFARRARFLRRSRLGYVVIDTSSASAHLRRFAIHLLALVKVDCDGAYELYVPDLTSLEADDDPRTQIADSTPLPLNDQP